MNPKFAARVREAWPDEAEQVLAVFSDELNLDEFPPTAELIRQALCTHKSSYLKMVAVNHILGGHGIEAIFGESETWPDMEYVNMGDTYITTMVHDFLNGTYRVMSWGDWIEEAERQGRTYA